jgi:hypothetical protein
VQRCAENPFLLQNNARSVGVVPNEGFTARKHLSQEMTYRKKNDLLRCSVHASLRDRVDRRLADHLQQRNQLSWQKN